METNVQQQLVKIVNKKIVDANWCITLSDVLGKLTNGYYEKWYVNMIFQNHERYPLSIYDAYAFSLIHCDICSGKIVLSKIGLGEIPMKDKCIDINNALLDRLWYPFYGKFWGGTQDSDGYIDVKEEIEMNSITPDYGKITSMADGMFPLEVGYTNAGKTMTYLRSNFGRLARWPYDSTDIILMANVSDRYKD